MPLWGPDFSGYSQAGNFTTASGAATPSTTIQPGMTALLIVQSDSGVSSLSEPFTLDAGPVALTGSTVSLYRYGPVETAITSVTITQNSAGPCNWMLYGISSHLSYDPPVALSINTVAAISDTELLSTGLTAEQTEWNVFALAIFAADNQTNTTMPDWGSPWSNSYVQEYVANVTGTGEAKVLKVGSRLPQNYGPYETSAPFSCAVTCSAAAILAVYRGAYDPPFYVTGFEHGTLLGATGGNTANLVCSSLLGAPTIITTSPKTGTYCLRCSTVAATAAYGVNPASYGAAIGATIGSVAVRFPTSLPAADLDVITFDTSAGSDYALRFRSSDGSLVMGIAGGGGTPTAGPVVVPDVWYTIDWYWSNPAGTATIQWRVDLLTMDDFVDVGAGSQTITAVYLGWITNYTATVDYDDLCVSALIADYPIGITKVVLLKVDPAGTVAVNTAASFSLMSANGTINATFNATTCRDALDEVPPSIGASADGFVQDAIDAAGHVDIPLTTYTLQGGEAVIGLRVLCCGWAVSTTAATLGFRVYNGTIEELLQAGTVNPLFNNSTTAPGWFCKMASVGNFDTQAKVDNTQIRVGWSSDANPDIGAQWVGAELAIGTVGTPPATSRWKGLPPGTKRPLAQITAANW